MRTRRTDQHTTFRSSTLEPVHLPLKSHLLILESRRDHAEELLERLRDARIGFTEGSMIRIESKALD